MKNLQHYKKQKKERTFLNACERATENCNAAMYEELKRRMQPHYAASQERWDGMLKSLRTGNARDYRLHNPRVATLIAATNMIIRACPNLLPVI
jgi:hypothetical protein